MVQVNLLPEVKKQYLKTRRLMQTVVSSSVIVVAVMFFIFVAMLVVAFVVQKKVISDLSSQIKNSSQELQSTKNLDKILTIQNQLKTLPQLHDQRVTASRLREYLAQVTPADVNIGRVGIDFNAKTMAVSGTAPNLTAVNTFVDSLKFTTFTDSKQGTSQKKAFSNVVMAQFNRSIEEATYNVTFAYDGTIFAGTAEPSLTVPSMVTTRSEIDKPTSLFKEMED